MAFGFDKNSTQTTVTISQLRNVVTDRLQAAQGRAGLTDSFNGAADNMVGSLLFSLLTWTPIMAGLESAIEGAFGPSDAFNALSSPALAAAADASPSRASRKEALRPASHRRSVTKSRSSRVQSWGKAVCTLQSSLPRALAGARLTRTGKEPGKDRAV
jgi:hypothetical protein